ncbi:HAMP domain-containing histidine kinase [Ornithinibacillus massiliensis]|uniref:histidine kinase n=1 Tax=Ornithinibacillus massiliensis TaxID=1944633 RepID=A0ABS5M974_9BACI|nr:HAMP domain-containing sensor histidine kinase [Ornithinibacillus massiliensis]MBS3678865.1 HAMP domain-containing histidine kinase [Ornithinibacillus massiliensis]
MKTIRIRTFTILCCTFLTLVPWVFFVTVHVMETKSFRFDIKEEQRNQLEQTIQLVEENKANWTSPVWQDQFNQHLKENKIDVSIQSASDDVIFESSSYQDRSSRKSEQVTVMEDGQIVGKFYVSYANTRMNQTIAAVLGFVIALLLSALALRKFILKPLEGMGSGARQIAEGDLDVELPKSIVTEIADVRDGFNVMVEGLKKSFRKQAELDENRRFVIAAVAHDLRTPLFALRGYLDGLEHGIADSPEKRAKYLAVCKEKSAQLDRLVEDLFTYTKTEISEMELKKDKVNLAQVVEHAIDTLTPSAKDKNITMMRTGVGGGVVVTGDAHLLERAITNILDNAVRHTPPHGKITIHLEQANQQVIFSVRDTGVGFTEEELKHAFDPLFRGEKSRNALTGGAGLGLTISQRIIRLHGGELTITNHATGGAIVKGSLPWYCEPTL